MNAASPDAWLAECRARVDEYLDKRLPPADEPPIALHEALRYAVFSEGKRLRPALAFASALACGSEPDRVLPVAAAAELVHAYSLAHVDLPAMDDDDERRGRPSLHVQFGEAEAVLAGDALLAEAFATLAEAGAPSQVILRLARAAGSRALVGGQSDDLRFDAATSDLAAVRSIHLRKTGALFDFAVCGAAEVSEAQPQHLECLARFSRAFGLAFQAVDDLLDADPDECSLLAVQDEAAIRAGVSASLDEARAALEPFGERGGRLAGLAEGLAVRLP